MTSIFLLPYGGGSAASYRAYANRFPRETGQVIPVEIPGRGKRSHEEYAKTIQECAALALQEIDTESAPYILHGHCMGALLAFEAIKLIEASGKQLPIFMLASGRNAPRHINDWLRRVPETDDRSLFKELQDFGGIPRGLSFAMAQNFLTVLRHDQAMIRDYEPGETKISVPILVLASRDDKMTNAAELADWKDYTSKFLSIEWLDGQHYSFMSQPDRVALHLEEFGNL
jgi:surfactin synthase thioesterase subunit